MIRRRGGLAFIALLAIAVSLRSPLTSLPPLVDQLRDALGLSSFAAGALTSLPVVCMGLLSPIAPRLAARYGIEKSIGFGIGLIAIGTAGRAPGGVAELYIGTFVLGAGIAITGALIPAAVRHSVPQSVGGATSLVNGVTMGVAALAAATSIPLADHFGWPVALGVWAIPAALAFIVWAPRMRDTSVTGAQTSSRLPWRSRTAWLITGYLTANGVLFYSLLAWLPAAYMERGWSDRAAGAVLGGFSVGQLLVALGLIVILLRWRRDRRMLYVAAAVLSLLGMLAVAIVPESAPWLIILILGAGLGAGFTFGLVQLAHHVHSTLDATRLSAMVFLVSYLASASGPVLTGLVFDSARSFTPAFIILAVIAGGQVLVATRLHSQHRVGNHSTEA